MRPPFLNPPRSAIEIDNDNSGSRPTRILLLACIRLVFQRRSLSDETRIVPYRKQSKMAAGEWADGVEKSAIFLDNQPVIVRVGVYFYKILKIEDLFIHRDNFHRSPDSRNKESCDYSLEASFHKIFLD